MVKFKIDKKAILPKDKTINLIRRRSVLNSLFYITDFEVKSDIFLSPVFIFNPEKMFYETEMITTKVKTLFFILAIRPFLGF